MPKSKQAKTEADAKAGNASTDTEMPPAAPKNDEKKRDPKRHPQVSRNSEPLRKRQRVDSDDDDDEHSTDDEEELENEMIIEMNGMDEKEVVENIATELRAKLNKAVMDMKGKDPNHILVTARRMQAQVVTYHNIGYGRCVRQLTQLQQENKVEEAAAARSQLVKFEEACLHVYNAFDNLARRQLEKLATTGRGMDRREADRDLESQVTVPDDELIKTDIMGASAQNDINEILSKAYDRLIDPAGTGRDVFACELSGQPGTGKTTIAKLVAARANKDLQEQSQLSPEMIQTNQGMFAVRVLSVSASTLLSSNFGQSEQAVASLFRVAQECQPVVVIMDEYDQLFSKQGTGGNAHAAVRRITTEFMNLFTKYSDGSCSRVFLVGCTNYAQNIEEAVSRRMTPKFTVKLPAASELMAAVPKMVVSYLKNSMGLTDVKEDSFRDDGESKEAKDSCLAIFRQKPFSFAELEQIVEAAVRKNVVADAGASDLSFEGRRAMLENLFTLAQENSVLSAEFDVMRLTSLAEKLKITWGYIHTVLQTTAVKPATNMSRSEAERENLVTKESDLLRVASAGGPPAPESSTAAAAATS